MTPSSCRLCEVLNSSPVGITINRSPCVENVHFNLLIKAVYFCRKTLSVGCNIRSRSQLQSILTQMLCSWLNFCAQEPEALNLVYLILPLIKSISGNFYCSSTMEYTHIFHLCSSARFRICLHIGHIISAYIILKIYITASWDRLREGENIL